GPRLPAGGAGDVPVLSVSSRSDQLTALTWDGSMLALAVPAGYAVSIGDSRDFSNSVPMAIDCSPEITQPSAVNCAVSAIPPVQVTFDTVARAPAGTLSLSYSDDYGRGTMT